MKAIKVCDENKSLINKLLDSINGRALNHTFSGYLDVKNLAIEAENRLNYIDLPKAKRAGAEYLAISGEKVHYSYSHKRKATLVELKRKTQDWYLTDVVSTTISTSGGYRRLYLTENQSNLAHEILSKCFGVITETAAETI